ncbi:MAG: hypothetical protein AB9922_12245 [Bacteroidales bacterium]
MTVKELIEELQQYDQDLEVVRVVDFENTDEHGNCQVESLESTMKQVYHDDQFGSDNDETVVMIY